MYTAHNLLVRIRGCLIDWLLQLLMQAENLHYAFTSYAILNLHGHLLFPRCHFERGTRRNLVHYAKFAMHLEQDFSLRSK